MANLEHLAKLSEGMDAWNEWRARNPTLIPDLSGATLHDPMKEWAILDHVKQDLKGVNFSRTNLRRCLIRDANLRGVNFRKADLKGADLRKSNLSHADLTGARLNHVNFTLTSLKDTNFHSALFWETILARTEIKRANGLEFCKHGGPSVVDHRTIRKSPDVPDQFWLACGVPEVVLKSCRQLSAKGPEHPSCFISYSNKDSDFALKLHADLTKKDIDCWIYEHDMQGGYPLDDQIWSAIEDHDRVIVVLSEKSIESDWVLTEIERAREKEQELNELVLFPIRLCDYSFLKSWTCFDPDLGVDVAKVVRRYFIPDFSLWKDEKEYRRALERLLSALQKT